MKFLLQIFLPIVMTAFIFGCGASTSEGTTNSTGGGNSQESSGGNIGGTEDINSNPVGKLLVISGGRILTFDSKSSGNSAPLSGFGDKTELGSPQGIAIDTVNNELVVANTNYHTVTVYGGGSSGNIPPLRSFSGPLLVNPSAVAVDPTNNEIYVANKAGMQGNVSSPGSIAVYSRTANGAVDPIRTISGNSTNISDPYGVAVDIANNELYVLNRGSHSITVYSRLSNGNVAPSRVITVATSRPNAFVLDTSNNELIVGTGSRIDVYPSTGNGEVTPTRTISGAGTGLVDARGVFVDSVRNELYVVDYGSVGAPDSTNSVKVYARTANGDVAPLRTISGTATGLQHPVAIAVDQANALIAVTNITDFITLYPQTSNGNIAPTRAISGVATGVRHPLGLAFDKATNEVFLSNSASFTVTVYDEQAQTNELPIRTLTGGLYGPGGIALDPDSKAMVVTNVYNNSLRIYEKTATGNDTPVRIIAGPNTDLGTPFGVAVDSIAKEIYVANATNSITVYGLTDDGDISPKRNISGSNTGLGFPRWVAVDTENGEIFIANSSANSITVYDRAASGNVTPKRTILGASTGLGYPTAVTIDIEAGEIFVSNASLNTITVYSRTANGNVAPARTISGPLTGLSHLQGLLIVK